MGAVNLNAYFERIGFAGSIAPNAQTLEALHALHPAAIPFENLDPVLGVPVRLDQASIEAKLLHARRGGYCFEHNLLFKSVLEDLGYTVRPIAARGLFNHPPGAERPIGHMALAVEAAGTTWLADVGFGSFTLTAPLKLRPDVEQQTPNETFRLVALDSENYRLEVLLDEDWHHVYRFDLKELTEADYTQLNDFIQADHREHLLLSAARADRGVRHTLFRNRFSTYRNGEPRERRLLADVAEIKSVLSETMRIALPPSDQLDPLLQQVLQRAAADVGAA